MEYKIIGGSFPAVSCKLQNGESMIAESGSMIWMSPNMEMTTQGGGIGNIFSRAFSGERLFQNVYTAHGQAHLHSERCPPVSQQCRPRSSLDSGSRCRCPNRTNRHRRCHFVDHPSAQGSPFVKKRRNSANFSLVVTSL